MKRIALYTLALLFAVYAIVAAPSSAKPGSAPGTNGSYDVVFAGSYSGAGKLVVGGGKITVFNGSLTDESGAVGAFSATSLPLQLDNGRFSGSGAVMGKTVTLCGRVEPPDGKIVKKARVVCTFSSGAGNGTRVYGSK